MRRRRHQRLPVGEIAGVSDAFSLKCPRRPAPCRSRDLSGREVVDALVRKLTVARFC